MIENLYLPNGRTSSNGNGRSTTKAVVLAGGRGTRLAPYTSVLPKPLMPIGDRAVLEVVVEQLADCGITDITFCVGYLSHLIEAVFESRENGHVDVTYVREQEPRGTAGPLRLIEPPDAPFIVMNGDVLTTLDFRALLQHHVECRNALTIATQERSSKIDYGVLYRSDRDDPQRITDYEEKPELTATVSMGIYVVDPAVLDFVPEEGHFDFPDLVNELLRAGGRVGSYAFDGVWFDIGRREDYEQAVETWLRLDPSVEQILHTHR